MKTIIFVFFRDFRIIDNTTLNHLAQSDIRVLPIFVFTPTQISEENQYRSDNSVECLCKGLVDLNRHLLQQFSKGLNIYYGDTLKVLEKLRQKLPHLDGIAFNHDLTPYARKRDASIQSWCNKVSLKCIYKLDYTLLNPNATKTAQGTYYKTFSHFYKKVIQKSQEIIETINAQVPRLQLIGPIHLRKYSLDIEEIHQFYQPNPHTILPQFNRQEILLRLKPENLEMFKDYKEKRKYPQYNTTHFGTFLKYGLVSFREVYQAVYRQFGKEDELLRQLVWKEYYAYLMYHLPPEQTIGKGNFQNKTIQWENNPKWLEKWKMGKTGFPFIDACMRQMNTTGWMHNAGRLSVANFLVYCLFIDWREGEKYFAQTLIDYDISQNNGNWQWCAGVGIDRKPWLRMYNPYNLINKHDPQGIFTHKWCPELKIEDILSWENQYSKYPQDLQPIVNYQERREIAKKYLM